MKPVDKEQIFIFKKYTQDFKEIAQNLSKNENIG